MCAAYIKNRRYPKTDPCGMPNKSIISIDRLPLNKTCWDLSVRNDWIQVRVIPPKLRLDCSLDSKMSRSTQSKTALKSSKARRVTCWLSIAVNISDKTRSTAVSVE